MGRQGQTLRVTQGRFIICAAMCQPHCVVDSIVRLATRSGHLATILHPTKPAADMLMVSQLCKVAVIGAPMLLVHCCPSCKLCHSGHFATVSHLHGPCHSWTHSESLQRIAPNEQGARTKGSETVYQSLKATKL